MAWVWLKFPPGMSGISVAQNEYETEVVDPKDGLNCFRAPEYYVGHILDGTGIRTMSAPPEGAPTDDPEPERSPEGVNVALLGGQINALQLEKEGLQAALTELLSRYQQLELEKSELLAKLSQFVEANPELAKELEVGTEPKPLAPGTSGTSRKLPHE